MNTFSRRWYITLIAAYYLFICAGTCAYYLSQDLSSHGAFIPWSIQLLCLSAALSAAIYFINPSLGHRALLFTTLITLFAIGETDLPATRFHLVILTLLLLPLFRPRETSAPAPL